MSCEMTFLGQSGFVFSDGEARLVVDPFLTGNPVAKHSAEEIQCDYLALTHGHGDHLGDTVEIARANDATVIAAHEITEYLGEQGLEKFEPGNHGGRIKTSFGWVAFTVAFHSSSFGGRYLGMPCGLVIRMGGKTIYHCGDTDLFSDMKLIGEIYQPDVALIPIGDRYTMGPELANRAAEFIGAPVAVPVHYNTFPLIAVDVAEFSPSGVEVKVLEPGESWTLS